MISLRDHFTYGKLIRFTFPSIIMMIFTSIYGIVDGYFISNYAGSVPFAAVNLIMPFIMIFAAFGTVFGSGGSALISMTMGMGKKKEANEIFSFVIYFVIFLGIITSIIGWFITEPVARLLGATEEMLPACVLYGQINMVGNTAYMLQYLFQSFMVTAERPKMGLYVTIAAGVTNMVLDWLFVGIFHWGVSGAAWATVVSQLVGGLIPLIYFFAPNHSPYRLGKTHFDVRWLTKAAGNGSSEFMSTVSTSVISILYNYQLLQYAGENGVAAYGVLMYANYIFVGVYFGYTMGAAPVISFHYGAQNQEELKGLFRKSLRMIAIAAIVLTGAAQLLSGTLVNIFVGYDASLYAMTLNAFRIYAVAFIFMGFNIFGSGFFTALNNGKVSAFLSFFRTLVLQVVCVLVLPRVFGIKGIWFSVVTAEAVSLLITITCFAKYRNRYHYA
jgi:putative MATE family efflux protein